MGDLLQESKTENLIQQRLAQLSKARLIAITRTQSEESAYWAASVLCEAGFQAIELTFTVPNAAQVIQKLVTRFPDKLIGAGTVLSQQEAELALEAGAQFMVSPVTNTNILAWAETHHVLFLPGAMTPTEIHYAVGQGVQAIKFFPAACAGGPEFIKAMRGPFPQLAMVPTGGITLEAVSGYLKAGALAVGVGGALFPADALAHHNEAALKTQAKAYLDAAFPERKS